jgi:hypothetical protein
MLAQLSEDFECHNPIHANGQVSKEEKFNLEVSPINGLNR